MENKINYSCSYNKENGKIPKPIMYSVCLYTYVCMHVLYINSTLKALVLLNGVPRNLIDDEISFIEIRFLVLLGGHGFCGNFGEESYQWSTKNGNDSTEFIM